MLYSNCYSDKFYSALIENSKNAIEADHFANADLKYCWRWAAKIYHSTEVIDLQKIYFTRLISNSIVASCLRLCLCNCAFRLFSFIGIRHLIKGIKSTPTILYDDLRSRYRVLFLFSCSVELDLDCLGIYKWASSKNIEVVQLADIWGKNHFELVKQLLLFIGQRRMQTETWRNGECKQCRVNCSGCSHRHIFDKMVIMSGGILHKIQNPCLK